MNPCLIPHVREPLCKSFCKFLCESSTDYRDKGLHYLQTRLYLPTDWLLLHTQSGLLSSYYIERVEIEQRSRAAAPDTAPDQAAEFTPQRNRSTKQNPTKVSPRGNPKGESIGGSIWGSIWGSIGGSIRRPIDYWGKGEWEKVVEVAVPDTASDEAAKFTPQRNRSTKQNPTKVSPRGIQKGNQKLAPYGDPKTIGERGNGNPVRFSLNGSCFITRISLHAPCSTLYRIAVYDQNLDL